MKKLIAFCMVLSFVLCFMRVSEATNCDTSVTLDPAVAFSTRDDEPGGPEGEPDRFDILGGPWGGLMTNNSVYQYDEFYGEFDIDKLGAAAAVHLNLDFERFIPTPTPNEPLEFKIAVYEADGMADLSDFGTGKVLSFPITITNNAQKTISVDVTSAYNEFIISGGTFIGFRFFEPISTKEPDRVAQIRFNAVSLSIIQDPVTIYDVLDFWDDNVAEEKIKGKGKPRWRAKIRLWVMDKMLKAAARFIEKDKPKFACLKLKRVYKHSDGNESQYCERDFIEGEAVPEFAEMIDQLMKCHECDSYSHTCQPKIDQAW